MLCFCAAQLKFCFKTDLGRENSASYYRQGKQLLLTLLTMVTRWSPSTSNLYALIGQNLTGEFVRKIYTASWILLLWQLKLTEFCVNLDVFNCLFPLFVQNEFSCYQESSVIYGQASLFIGFLVEKYVTCHSRKSDFGWHRFRFAPCLMRKRDAKSEAILALFYNFQGCISNTG